MHRAVVLLSRGNVGSVLVPSKLKICCRQLRSAYTIAVHATPSANIKSGLPAASSMHVQLEHYTLASKTYDNENSQFNYSKEGGHAENKA